MRQRGRRQYRAEASRHMRGPYKAEVATGHRSVAGADDRRRPCDAYMSDATGDKTRIKVASLRTSGRCRGGELPRLE